MSDKTSGTATTDPAAIEGVNDGARLHPPRSVEAEGRRQEVRPASGVARQNRQGPNSKLFCDERRDEPQIRGSTHLSDGSGVLYYTIRIGGDELLPQEPSEVNAGLGEGLRRCLCLTKSILNLTPSHSALLLMSR